MSANTPSVVCEQAETAREQEPVVKRRLRAAEQPKYCFYTEPIKLEERPRRFLEAFAAILKHSNYGPVLDAYTRVSAKCSICTASCPVYQATGDPRDIPCHRSELLLKVYRRYFTLAGDGQVAFVRLLPTHQRAHRSFGRRALPMHGLQAM